MANNCYNVIIVSGVDTTDVNAMFRSAMEWNNESDMGWLPDADDFDALDYQHYLFDIYENDSDCWVCWTKWSPPIEELIIISRMHPTITFYMEWEECGMGLYGKCYITNGVLTSLVELSDDDLEQVHHDEDNDLYVWTRPDGSVETFECESEIYEQMLDRKEVKS
jgi:hypothetical protein